MSRQSFPIAIALAWILFQHAPLRAQPSFQGLGVGTRVYEVAGDGSRVVGQRGANAAIWSPAAGWTDLGFAGFAYGASFDGTRVTGWTGNSSSTLGGNRTFLWTESSGTQLLPLAEATSTGSQGLAISADGTTIVGPEETPSRDRFPTLWMESTGTVGLRAVSELPVGAEARGVSADGTYITGRDPALHGWIWDTNETRARLIGPPGGARFVPWAISADGTTVVGSSDQSVTPGFHASYWTKAEGIVPIQVGPATASSEARDVSHDGSLITGYHYPAGSQTAFVWDAQKGFRDVKDMLETDYGLELGDWSLRWAYVSDDGSTFAGFGTNPQGQFESWVAVVPEPSSLFLLGLGFLLLVPRWARHRRP